MCKRIGSNDDGKYLYDRISGNPGGSGSGTGSEAAKKKSGSNVLDDEPDLANSGVVAALKMARNKGYIDTEEKKAQGLGLKHLQVS